MKNSKRLTDILVFMNLLFLAWPHNLLAADFNETMGLVHRNNETNYSLDLKGELA